MASYSPIGPLAVLQEMERHNVLGDYLLLLAHDVLSNPEGYKRLMTEVSEKRKLFIMMDNSIVELGNALPARDVLDAADLVGANVVALPDVIGDQEASRKRVENDLPILYEAKYPLMMIPQGKDTMALIQCAQWLQFVVPVNSNGLEYWGIPRWIASEIGSRKPIVQYINGLTHDYARIHLLGMSTNFGDDLETCMLPNVMGIDSANPVVMGQRGKVLSTIQAYKHLPRGNYWTHKVLHPKALHNINWVREQIQS